MSWFEKMKSGLKTRIKQGIPAEVWMKCEPCGRAIYRRGMEKHAWICPSCGEHFRIGHNEYIRILIDEGTFREMDANLTSSDPLHFKDRRTYPDKLREGKEEAGLNEAICTGVGKVGGHPVAFGVLDARFILGTFGSAMGEKIVRLIDRAIRDGWPLIIISQSGGARMQESALSLMQLAKVSARLYRLSEAGLPYISILTHPTTGGVTASFGMLGDILIGEPNGLIGFAGLRVIMQALGVDELPEGFQKSESVLAHGFLDLIARRDEMKATLVQLIRFFGTSPERASEEVASAEALTVAGGL